jgi:hypothetical protein
MVNNKIQLTDLDFDTIKSNLKTYLQGQTAYTDYDFEGSAFSILLDVLAYNTHYNALYNNLTINESFLDSASKRSSVVSKAKEIGYVPASAQSAVAIVTVVAINNQVNAPSTLEITNLTPFTTSIDGTTYTFYTQGRYIASRVNNQYVFENIEIREGVPLVYSFEVDANTTSFTLPNANVDTSTIQVTVQENAQTSTSETFIESSSVFNIDGTSSVYFIKENDNQLHEIEFGNGVIGKQLTPGNVVTVQYFVCNGDAPNGARTFNYTGSLATQNQVFVTTIDPADGGSAAEPIEEIKWNAPRAYAAQNRCVTADDYRVLIKQLYPVAASVNVWGGEQAVPPQYGKVFISIIPDNDLTLTDSQKSFVLNNVVNPRKPLTVTAEIVDPQLISVELKTTVYVNSNSTNRDANEIATIVREVIEDYDDENLNVFGGVLKGSRLSALIDGADVSVVSNTTRMRLRTPVIPTFDIDTKYSIVLGNPIYKPASPEESVLSTGFFIPTTTELCFIDDVPGVGDQGTLRLFYKNPQTGEKITLRTAGRVNYQTGLIEITDLRISRLATTSFDFLIRPDAQDVVSTQNQFVSIDRRRLEVAVVSDSAATYSFTSTKY